MRRNGAKQRVQKLLSNCPFLLKKERKAVLEAKANYPLDMRAKEAEIKEAKKTKDASNAQLIELIQSNCIHRRRQVVFEEGRNFIRCLDCGKRLKKPKIEIATQGKPEDA